MLCAAIFVCVVAFFFWIWSKGAKPHLLDSVPGPPKLPLIGNGLNFIGFKPEEMFLKLRQFNQEYGDRFLIKIFNRRILHLHHPDDVEVVLSHSRNIKKSKPYRFLESWLGQGLLLSYGTKWHRRRKILTPTFHFNILKHFSAIIESKTRNLTETLRSMQLNERNKDLTGAGCTQKKGKVVEVMPLVSNFTLHTICETAMGTKLDEDRSNAAVEYKSAVLKMGTALLDRLSRVWLHPDFIFNLSPRGKIYRKYVEIIHAFPDDVIAERKKNFTPYGEDSDISEEVYGKKKLAMMDLLLAAEMKGEIDLEGIREEVNTFMFEGHDTTAMALTFALMLLAEYPDVQNKIYEECVAICGQDRPVSSTDLVEMKYLEAVIKETLRLYPSVPFIAREITEDFTLGDLKVPAGSEIAVHIYDLQRRRDYYEDPLNFNPERFLRGSSNKHAYSYIPFSAGPRNCIGQRFAMQEMKYALSEICREFTLGPVEGSRPHQVVLISDLVLRSANPIYIEYTPRRTNI